MIDKSCLIRLVKHVEVSAFSTHKTAKSIEVFTNGNFPYKWKFLLQKKSLCLKKKKKKKKLSLFLSLLALTNPDTKELVYSDKPHHPAGSLINNIN